MADDRLYEVLGVSRYASDNEIKKVGILIFLLWPSKLFGERLQMCKLHLFVTYLHLLQKT